MNRSTVANRDEEGQDSVSSVDGLFDFDSPRVTAVETGSIEPGMETSGREFFEQLLG